MWQGFIGFVIAVAAGLFGLIKYLDQRQRELEQRKFEQYWKLIDIFQGSPFVAKQQIALLLLKRCPNFKSETVAFLSESKRRNDDWTKQNIQTIDQVLNHFGQS